MHKLSTLDLQDFSHVINVKKATKKQLM